jgi:hypothetical protein
VQYLVVAGPRAFDQIQMLTEAAKRWYERYRTKFEASGNFVSGGGFGVVNAEDEQELSHMTWEKPFIPLSDVTVHAVWPGAGGFDFIADVARRVISGGSPS